MSGREYRIVTRGCPGANLAGRRPRNRPSWDVLAMGANMVSGLGTPTDDADAATKSYVDTGLGGRLARAGGTMSGNLAGRRPRNRPSWDVLAIGAGGQQKAPAGATSAGAGSGRGGSQSSGGWGVPGLPVEQQYPPSLVC